MKIYFISKEKFIEWYFQDADDYKNLGHTIAESLKYDGKAKMSIQDLWDSTGCVPSWILTNWDGEENAYLDDIDGFDFSKCEFKFEGEL